MPSLVTLLGSCFLAASAAAAADRPADQAREPWWSNPPTAESPASGPKIMEYGPAAANPGPQVAKMAPPDRAGQTAEFAPQPPDPRRPDALPVIFQQDSMPAETPAEKTRAVESPRGAAVRTPPQPQLSPAAPAAGTPPPAGASPPTVQPESARSFGLGSHNDKNAPGKRSPLSAMITVGGSLTIVLGLFFVVAWAMRKAAPRGSLLLPKEVFDILGRAPLGARQQVQLLRCGNKLLLVSITPNGTETLTEVTDPLEVDRIAGICQQAHPKSATTAFRQVFQQLAPKSGEPSELDHLEPAGTRRKRYRWEERHA